MIPFPEEARVALVAAGYPEDELEPSEAGAFLRSYARTVILDFHPTRAEGWRANLQDHGRVVAIADGTTAERALRAALVVASKSASSPDHTFSSHAMDTQEVPMFDQLQIPGPKGRA